ncbi:hypothetical protein C2I06_12540 [Niallia circulans]|uniref:hypothetical protein n=1 Tax=Niallia circulans TaxID=1397 RepID=UPI000F452338|nr:hypothetical protein [Niallia circulans]AYV67628.1 hypothetical protein C2I06_12540 [Niallia circulans]
MKKPSYFIIFLLIFLLAGCGKEAKFEKAIEFLKENNWEEANEILSKLPSDYKETLLLKHYANGQLFYSKSKDKEQNFAKNIDELNMDLSTNYNGEFREDINNLIEEMTEKQEVYDKKISEKNLKEAIELVHKEDFESSLEKINQLTHIKNTSSAKNYIQARIEFDKDSPDINKYLLYLSKISSNYDGILEKEIHSYIENHTIGWKEIKEYAENVKFLEENIIERPSLQMTSDEVRNSTWGEPMDINKTTTSSGIHEQWVYYGNRYIYLDNGIVTAIQE